MNVVMNNGGAFIEVQGTAEGHAFRRHELDALLDLAASGIGELCALQAQALGAEAPRPAPGPRHRQAGQAARIRGAARAAGDRTAAADRPRHRELGRDRHQLRRQRAAQGAPCGAAPAACRRSPTIPGSRSMRSAARPGVRSARYAGAAASDAAEQRAGCCDELAASGPPAPRAARYRCVLALRAQAARSRAAAGRGPLGRPDRDGSRAGSGGFGYDRCSCPGASTQTAAQIDRWPSRTACSHRASGAAQRSRCRGSSARHAGAVSLARSSCRRSRCTCTSPGACASARTATSIRMRCTARCRRSATSSALLADLASQAEAVRGPNADEHLPRRRHAEPVLAGAVARVLAGAARAARAAADARSRWRPIPAPSSGGALPPTVTPASPGSRSARRVSRPRSCAVLGRIHDGRRYAARGRGTAARPASPTSIST